MSTVIFILFILGGLMSAYSFAMIINKGRIPFGMLSLTAIVILIATALKMIWKSFAHIGGDLWIKIK